MNKFRKFVLRLFGMGHYVNLFEAFDNVCHKSKNYSAVIYPSGEYFAKITMPDGQTVKSDPFITDEERAAYINGMKFAMEAMRGGLFLYENDLCETDEWLEEMSDQDRELLHKKSQGNA